MRRMVMLLVALFLAAPLAAQRISIDVPGLADKASETVNVTLDGSLLKLASKFLSSDDPDERKAQEIVRQLTGIYVRSYEFDSEGEYDRRAIAEHIHGQLGPSWKKIVDVQSRVKESAEIYVDTRGENVAGLMILSAEPKELTIVHLVGPIDLDKLAALEGQFGIPRLSRAPERRRE